MSVHGRRVVVTRAAEQAADLVALLEQAGAVPVVLPLIEIELLDDGVSRLQSLDLDAFDWLAVTSPNGAAFIDAPQSGVKIAAVGTATAEVLRAKGLDVDLVPARQSAAGLLDEFPHRGDGGGQILVVQAANAEATLIDGLREQGWRVTVVAPYRTVPARVTAGQQLAALSADAVLFASGSAAEAWASVFGDATPPIVVAIGPQTAAAAERAGLKVTSIAADHSLSGMVSALADCLSSNR